MSLSDSKDSGKWLFGQGCEKGLFELYSFNKNHYLSLDMCLNDSLSIFQSHGDHTTSTKNNIEKLIPIMSALRNTSLGKPKLKKIWVLLDNGGSTTIMHSTLAKNL